MEKKQNLTQQKHTFIDQNKCSTTQNKHNKLKPGLVASYDIQPGNTEGLFLFRCFINMSSTYLDTYPFTALDRHGVTAFRALPLLVQLVEHQEEHPACKKLTDEMMAWLFAYGPAEATE